MLQSPYFFFDVVYLHNGTEEQVEDTSWKVWASYDSLKLYGSVFRKRILNVCVCVVRTCTPPSVSWTLRECVIALRCHCVVLLLSCTTAWPNCCATRCRDPSRATRPTVCWRTTTRQRTKPRCDAHISWMHNHRLINSKMKEWPVNNCVYVGFSDISLLEMPLLFLLKTSVS